jgi:hypothetical protein
MHASWWNCALAAACGARSRRKAFSRSDLLERSRFRQKEKDGGATGCINILVIYASSTRPEDPAVGRGYLELQYQTGFPSWLDLISALLQEKDKPATLRSKPRFGDKKTNSVPQEPYYNDIRGSGVSCRFFCFPVICTTYDRDR